MLEVFGVNVCYAILFKFGVLRFVFAYDIFARYAVGNCDKMKIAFIRLFYMNILEKCISDFNINEFLFGVV